MHSRQQFSRLESQVIHAVVLIQFSERNAPRPFEANEINLSLENQQGRSDIAGESRKTLLATGGNMTGIATLFQTIVVTLPPPFALIVI